MCVWFVTGMNRWEKVEVYLERGELNLVAIYGWLVGTVKSYMVVCVQVLLLTLLVVCRRELAANLQ